MELIAIDLKKFRQLSQQEKAARIAEYEAEKQSLINEYLRLQDIVDQYNEDIYQITCKIELINIFLQENQIKII